MWVDPAVRGVGLGRRLLVAEEARAEGVTVLHPETNETLTEAMALYRSAGYVEVPPFATSRTPTTGSRSGSTRRARRRR